MQNKVRQRLALFVAIINILFLLCANSYAAHAKHAEHTKKVKKTIHAATQHHHTKPNKPKQIAAAKKLTKLAANTTVTNTPATTTGNVAPAGNNTAVEPVQTTPVANTSSSAETANNTVKTVQDSNQAAAATAETTTTASTNTKSTDPAPANNATATSAAETKTATNTTENTATTNTAATASATDTAAETKPADTTQANNIAPATPATAAQPAVPPPNIDPYEGFNRAMFTFNDKLDTYLMKPVATVYKKIMPKPLFQGIHNFFSNLGELPIIANDILQFNFTQMANDMWRLGINTTLGIGGIFDVATRINLKYYANDFGLTMAAWGYTDSDYLVLPFFGPNTIRDGVSIPVDYFVFSIYPYIYPESMRYQLYGLSVLDRRAQLLDYQSVLEEAAVDRYVFMRNAYMQRRKYQIEQNKHLGGRERFKYQQKALPPASNYNNS